MCSLIAIGIFAFLVIIWYDDHYLRWNEIRSYFKEVGRFNMFKFFYIVSIAALCLAFLHAVFGILGSM